MLQAYAGGGVVEQGFHYAIDDMATPATSSASGGLTNSGVYIYRTTLEYTNAQGEIVMGPTSAGTSVTLGAGDDTATLTAPTYRHTARTDPLGEVRIGVWRTENGAAVYYRVSSLDPNDTGANGYLANDPTADTVSFVDKLSDADLISREPLYTNGGILVNDPTPVGAIVTAGKNRLFVTDPGDPLLVRYSQEIRDGYTVEMSPALTVKMDPQGGDITGLVVMDDSVVVFKKTAIFFFAGPGPLANPNAGSSDFSAPQFVTTDVGCSNARSICYTPAGVVFQSEKGIYLLSRSMEVTYIGHDVEGFNSQDIVSCDLTEDRRQIRLLTDDGSTLLWNYFVNQWSACTNHEGADAITVDGTYHYLRTNGEVYKETAEYLDVNRQIPMVVETAWIRFGKAMQGFQRIYHVLILGEYKSLHTLRVRYQLDYEPGWREPIDIAPGPGDGSLVTPGGYEYVLIQDADQTGLDITGDLTFEIYCRLVDITSSVQLISKYSGPSNRSYTWGFSGVSSTFYLHLNNSARVGLSAAVTLSPDVFYRFAVTYDSVAGGVLFYVDGVDIGTVQDMASVTIWDAASFVGFGNGVDSITIDDARMWDDVRTPAELLANKSTELDGDEANLVGYWKFNGNLLDSGPNRNDLSESEDNAFTFTPDTAMDDAVGWFYNPAPYGEGPYGDGVYGGTFSERYQIKIHVGQKCEAIRFRIEDVMGSSTGASFELSEILITGGVKRPDYHMSDTRSY